MSNLEIKRAAALALAGALTVLTLTGCAGQSLSASGSGINSPVVISYTVNNPLTIEEHDTEEGESSYRYFTVNGLKDEEIEKKINDRIKEVYDGLCVPDLPPYRGIKMRIDEGAELVQEQVYAGVSGNFNNILSVSIYKHASYRIPSDTVYSSDEKEYYNDIRYFSEEETLNLDLNTGEEFSLKDLFCDDVDYMELINDRMSRYLAESHAEEEGHYSFTYGGLKLVESFKGLSEDQKFTVYPNGVTLVFDYNTPQFDTEFMAIGATFNFSEFGDRIAITERSYDEAEDLYTSEEPPVKSLPYKDIKNDISGRESWQDGGVSVFLSWQYSSSLPEEIKKLAAEMAQVDQEAVEEAKAYFSGMSQAEIDEKGGGYHDVSVTASSFGRYVNIYKYSYIYTPQNGRDTVEGHCYDVGTGKALTLDDLFIEGYDYKPVIMEAIRKTIAELDYNISGIHERTYSETEDGSVGSAADGPGAYEEKYSDEQYEKAYAGIDGFRLDTDAVSMYIEHPVLGDTAYALNLYIPYADFGCDNMTIFR